MMRAAVQQPEKLLFIHGKKTPVFTRLTRQSSIGVAGGNRQPCLLNQYCHWIASPATPLRNDGGSGITRIAGGELHGVMDKPPVFARQPQAGAATQGWVISHPSENQENGRSIISLFQGIQPGNAQSLHGIRVNTTQATQGF